MKSETNGEARVALKTRWRGIAVRFGKDPNEETEHVWPARISPKLVVTSISRFNRQTGADCGRGRYNSKGRRLVAYRLAFGEWITV